MKYPKVKKKSKTNSSKVKSKFKIQGIRDRAGTGSRGDLVPDPVPAESALKKCWIFELLTLLELYLELFLYSISASW